MHQSQQEKEKKKKMEKEKVVPEGEDGQKMKE